MTESVTTHDGDVRIALGFDVARRVEIVALLRAYQAGLGIPLSFQRFEDEVEHLPGAYAPPDGAFAMAELAGALVGVAALRPLDRARGIAEMKRLYVSPSVRGRGLGRRLVEAILDDAARLGYARVRLDTLPSMLDAQALYTALGFVEIARYNDNPIAGSRFLEIALGGERP